MIAMGTRSFLGLYTNEELLGICSTLSGWDANGKERNINCVDDAFDG